MKQKVFSIIQLMFITLIMMFIAGCSIEKSVKDNVTPDQKNEASTKKGSTGDLQLSLGQSTSIIAIAGGAIHSMAVDSNGQLWGTGNNGAGQLGMGGENGFLEWVKVSGMDKVSAVSCGNNHTLIIRNYTSQGNTWGEVWVSGYNNYGQLGLSGSTYIASTFKYTGINNVTAIAAGGEHSMLIKGGTLYVTGRNEDNELGLGNNSPRYGFTHTGITDVRSIDAGQFHSLFVTYNGNLFAAGRSAEGQLGLPGTSSYKTWTQVPGMDKVSSIACGNYHSIITRDLTSKGNAYGEVWATGKNADGELGFGDNTKRNSFDYTGTNNATSIATGNGFSMIIKDGNIWSTGTSAFGQIGLSNGVNKFTQITKVLPDSMARPTAVGRVELIAAGNWHSLLVTRSLNIWSTGYVGGGQLGLGDNNSRFVYSKCP